MTRKVIRNYPRSLVAPLVAILTLLIAAAVQAQETALTAVPAQVQERAMLPGGGNAERVDVSRLRMKGHGPVVMDESPPLFLPAVTYHSGGFDLSLAVADVNGDGTPDVLMTDYDGYVDVLMGNGDGTFQTPVAYNSGGSAPYSVAVADLKGDGKRDLAVANFSSNTVGVLLGSGDGTFQSAVSYASSNSDASCPDFVALADVNGDGKPDMVVLNYCGVNYLTSRRACLSGMAMVPSSRQ
jgi:hypothetical protein